MENKLLSVMIFDRATYDNIKDTVDNQDFSDLGQLIIDEIHTYYNADENAQEVDKDVITSRLERNYPEQMGVLSAILESLQPVSIPNVLAEYLELRIHSLGRRIAVAIQSNASGNTIRELMSEYDYLCDKGEQALLGEEDENVSIGLDVDDIFEELDPANLIHIEPSSLNSRLNEGAPRGTHIVVYARPETGKSMFVINMTAGFLRQGLRVFYAGNEDPQAVMKQRLMSSLTGRTRVEILGNRDAVIEEARDYGYGNLIFFNGAPGSVSDIRRLVHRFKPDVFIVDQIRNLHSTKNLTKVEALEYIAQSMRNLGKEANALAVSVTQAGDSADGKLSLELGDVDFSNTGIPSAADLMIGIGVNREYENMDRRMISLPKNKISGIHESFPIRVFPQLSKVENV